MNRFTLTSLAVLTAAAGAAAAFAAAGQTEPAPSPAPAPPAAASASASGAPASKPDAAPSAVREIELPADTGTYRQGPGAELAQAFCLNCHSVEYCETQPLSGEKYWGATVKKMKEKFGAPLPDEAIAPLTKYLTETYGKPTP